MTELVLHQDTEASTPDAWPGSLPFLSILVPVRNEERFISQLLDGLLTQDYPPDRFEVLVADGRSTDATREIIRAAAVEYPNLRLLDNPKRWSSAGRNVALRAARGEFVVLIDGHCELYDPNYLRNLAEAFARSGADALGRPQPLDTSTATTLQLAIASARASRLGHNPASQIYASQEKYVKASSVAVAYRRAVFARIGLFDETFDACEDVELNHRLDRAGLRCFFTPRITLRYHPRATLTGLFRQMARYGRGRVRLFRKHPDTFTLPCFLPGAFVLGAGAGLPLAILFPWLASIYFGVLGLYAVLLLLGSLGLALQQRNPRLLPWLPLAFLAIHFGAGTGILLEMVARQRQQAQDGEEATSTNPPRDLLTSP